MRRQRVRLAIVASVSLLCVASAVKAPQSDRSLATDPYLPVVGTSAREIDEAALEPGGAPQEFTPAPDQPLEAAVPVSETLDLLVGRVIPGLSFADPLPISDDYPVVPLPAFQRAAGTLFELPAVPVLQRVGSFDMDDSGTFESARHDPLPRSLTYTANVDESFRSPRPGVTAVPEPASLLLFGAGVAALAAGRRRLTDRRRS